jgi:hypothetical protein
MIINDEKIKERQFNKFNLIKNYKTKLAGYVSGSTVVQI